MVVETLAEGLAHPEGPAVLGDGFVAFVEGRASRISRWTRGLGVDVFADTGGCPNACAAGDDGLYFTQLGRGFGGWEPAISAPASIGFVSWGGIHTTVVTEVDGRQLDAPNDLAFSSDGWLWFTDPGEFDPENPRDGWLHALGPSHQTISVNVGPVFPNGVIGLPESGIAWVESYTRRLMRLNDDLTPVEIATLAPGHMPDGFAAAEDGSYYVATVGSGGIDVVTADGRQVGFLPTGSCPLNCAFIGTDLVVTCDPPLSGSVGREDGRLLLLPLDVAGAPVFTGRVE